MAESRRLAAIVGMDVVGYSRLMGEDEAGTAQAVRGHREAAAPIVRGFGGRLVKTMGDGVLLEFPSVVAAVECAVTIQSMMAERNADTPEARRIVYRIGVHLGDVLIDGDDILGEGGQHRGAAGKHLRARRRLHISGRLRPDQRKACSRFPNPRSAKTEKHRQGGRGIRNRLCGQIGRRLYTRRREHRADGQILSGAGRSTPCLRNFGQRTAIGEVRKLAEPSGIRLGKPGLAACISRAVSRAYADSLRRERQRHVRLGC